MTGTDAGGHFGEPPGGRVDHQVGEPRGKLALDRARSGVDVGKARVRRSRIFLLGAAGEQEENGLGASASGPVREGSSRLPLGEERANILLLACCYQEGSNPGPQALAAVH